MEEDRALLCRGRVLMGKSGKSFAGGTSFGVCSANAMSPEKLSRDAAWCHNLDGYQQVKARRGFFRNLPRQTRPVFRRLTCSPGQ
jgi:hypothetical protein